MKIILNADVENLGKLGDVVAVKAGYARNYLLPRNLALLLNTHNQQLMEARKKKVLKKLELEKLTAVDMKAAIEKITLHIEKKAGESDTLFGSVTVNEIEQLLEERGIKVERRKLHFDEPIKRLGTYTCKVKLFEGIEAEFKIEVTREHDEETHKPVKIQEKEEVKTTADEVKQPAAEQENTADTGTTSSSTDEEDEADEEENAEDTEDVDEA